jgi:hypothetical protein
MLKLSWKEDLNNSKGNFAWYLQIIKIHDDYAHKYVNLLTFCGQSHVLTQNSILDLTVLKSQILQFSRTSKINFDFYFIGIKYLLHFITENLSCAHSILFHILNQSRIMSFIGY